MRIGTAIFTSLLTLGTTSLANADMCDRVFNHEAEILKAINHDTLDLELIESAVEKAAKTGFEIVEDETRSAADRRAVNSSITAARTSFKARMATSDALMGLMTTGNVSKVVDLLVPTLGPAKDAYEAAFKSMTHTMHAIACRED